MMQTNVESWANQQPDVLAVCQAFNRAGIDWGCSFGVLPAALGERTTSDLDILVSEDQFEAAAGVLGVTPAPRIVAMRASDNRHLVFETDEVRAQVGDTEVQIMRPAPMVGEDTNFVLDMTPLAARHRLSYSVGGVAIHFTNPFDTMAAKAVMWRGAEQGKQDMGDIRTLGARFDAEPAYARTRGQEIGLTIVEWNRLRTFGGILLHDRPGQHALLAGERHSLLR